MDLLRLLSDIRTPIVTSINICISVLGKGTTFLILLCLIYWCIDKKFAYRLGTIYIISGFIIQSFKIIFRIPRPWVRDTSFKPVTAAKASATGYSFPSGHTQNITAMFSSLAFKFSNKFLKILCYIVIFAVMFSRMYLGVHTPLDVGVSFAITFFISLIINYYADNYSLDENHLAKLMWILYLLPIAAVILTIYTRYMFSDITISNLKDIIKNAGLAFGFLIGWKIEKKYIHFHARATTLPLQILKYFIGISLFLAIKTGLKYIIKLLCADFLPAYFIEYMILTLFITVLYPLIIKRFFTTEYIYENLDI